MTTKPDTRHAMQRLIAEIYRAIPVDMPAAQLCAGPCSGCPKKLLEFLDSELESWNTRIAQGESPRLGDLSKLARTARKIHRVLLRNGLLPSVDTDPTQGGSD